MKTNPSSPAYSEIAPGTESPAFGLQTLFTPVQRDGWDCRYRIPNLLVSKQGTVFAFPEERTNSIEDDAKTNLVVRRSFDHGRTWTELEVLHTHDNPRIRHNYSGGVADVETGRVFVFVSVCVGIWPNDIGGSWPEAWVMEHPAEAAALREKLAPGVPKGLFLIWTDDEGENWSEPRPLGESLNVRNPVTGESREFTPQFVGTQLRVGSHAGRLVVPGRGWSQTAPIALYANSHNYVVISDDHGETWRAGGLTQNGTGEACLVELSDGTLYVSSRNESLRCRGYRARDRSHDGGETFTESGYDLLLPEPHCAASMATLPGEGVLFCNPAVFSGTASHYDHDARHTLTVRLSRDECRSWPVGRTVCEGPSGYSALAVCGDGSILCAYETLNETSYTGTILLARFTLDWLREGSADIPSACGAERDA